MAASHAEVDEELAAPAHYAHDLPALRHGKVSREIIEMLALDPAAVDRLDGLLRSAADLLMEIEVERVEVVHASDEEVVLRVPAYAEEGLGVADIILRGVLGILGEEKGMRFMESMESSVPLFWNDFGHFDRTITFSAKPRGAGQYWLEFRQDVPPDQVDAYYGHPVFGEVSVWPGFAMLLDVHSADFAGPGVGRSASFLPLLPVSMRALFELIEDWSSEQQQSSRR